MAESTTVERKHAASDVTQRRFVIRLCRADYETERIGNYLTRLPGGRTGSLAATPEQALQFTSVQSAEAGLAEHLAGLPSAKWDAVYEIVPVGGASDRGDRT